MLRDIPYAIATLITMILLMIGLGYYYQTSIKQDSITLNLNETVRSSVIANVDYKSRVNEGELFIVKENFEETVKSKINSGSVKLSEKANYRFEYLDNDNGSTKAVRVIIENGDSVYQSTAKIDISQ